MTKDRVVELRVDVIVHGKPEEQRLSLIDKIYTALSLGILSSMVVDGPNKSPQLHLKGQWSKVTSWILVYLDINFDLDQLNLSEQ